MSVFDRRLQKLESVVPIDVLEREGPIAAAGLSDVVGKLSLDEMIAAREIFRAHPDAMPGERFGLSEIFDLGRARLAAEREARDV